MHRQSGNSSTKIEWYRREPVTAERLWCIVLTIDGVRVGGLSGSLGGGWEPLNREAEIVGIQKLFERVKRHPGRATLLVR